MKKIAVLCLISALSSGAFAQMKPEDMIKVRQSGMNFMAWNMAKIKAMTIEQPSAYNKEQVQAAAYAIAAVANSGIGGLFAPGTDKGKGWKETKLKADYFQKGDEVKEVGMAFGKEANELAKVSASGDVDAIKAQFGKLGKACKSCHDKFKNDD